MRGSISARDLDDAVRSLQQLGGDLPAAVLADALNHTANQANQALVGEIDQVFDRPTPFTRNAVRILHATSRRLEAALWVKDEKDHASKGQAPEDWVAPQVFGGRGWTRRRSGTSEPEAFCRRACSSFQRRAPGWTSTAT
ncbi:hypothetical protein P4105_01315 [Pseudomonas aeruginosa]|nr:hypothetical protein [Pseudomonas aeruginosa]